MKLHRSMRMSRMMLTRRLTVPVRLSALAGMVALAGCAPQHLVRATDYQINVHINPAEHTLVARTTMQLQAIDQPAAGGEVWIGFDLHKDLNVTGIRVQGAQLRRTGNRAARKSPDDDSQPPNHRQHILYLDRAASFMTVTVDYYGSLHQDVQSGEKEGKIHNFLMAAHISPEGTYLAPEGHWYPAPTLDNRKQMNPALFLADWRLQADRIDDYELVASSYRHDEDPDRYVWVGPHKLSSMTLVGGPHEVWSQDAGEVEIRVHLGRADNPARRNQNEAVAKRYLEQAARYIERYEPLLGPFPYRQYTIIENFFSSGFAFPMMTLFGPRVMRMGDNSFRHGYLDHELVHSWWGCGVDVDPRDGNWCEALTTYCTNYQGFVLDGDEAGARKKRRDYSNFLSRIKPESDKPLSTFGLKDGAGRGIAYSKGAAVFHMIARTIGQENFWRACRMLTDQYMGRHADWDDLQRLFEQVSGQDLDEFFRQWVRGSGAPALALDAAEYDATTGELVVAMDQGDSAFSVGVPLGLYFRDGPQEDVTVLVTRAAELIAVPVSRPPWAVELDPDYHVFRKLKPAEIMPTTATTKSAKMLTVVVPPTDLLEPYATVADAFKKAVESRKESKAESVTVVADDRLSPEALNSGGVLILGQAVRHPVVQELLARTVCPVVWTASGFTVDGQEFNAPNHAVMCTVHHPDTPGDGVTIYAGNAEEALANASMLGYYANSLLVFEANERTKVILRRDFESHQRIELTTP